MDSNTNQKKKTWIWVGLVLVVIIAIGVIGAVLFSKGPKQVFETAIEDMYGKVDKLFDNASFNDLNELKENPISVAGTLSFKANMDLNGLEDFAAYQYGFQVGLDMKKKLANVGVSIQENHTDFLSATMAFQDDKAYVRLPGLLDKTLEIPDIKFDESFKMELPEITYNKEDIKALLRDTKQMFLDTIDPDKFTVNNNVEDDYNGKTTQTQEIIYTLDEANQKRTVTAMIDAMLQNSDYLNRLSKITSKSLEEIKESLEQSKNEFQYEEQIQLVVTVEGVMKNVIEVDFIEGEHAVSYIDYNNKETIHIDDVILTLEEVDSENIKLGYEVEDLKGILYLTSKKETDHKYAVTITITAVGKVEQQDVNLEVTMNMSENLNDTSIQKMDVENSVLVDQLPAEDALQLITNLQKKISGTPFEVILSSAL